MLKESTNILFFYRSKSDEQKSKVGIIKLALGAANNDLSSNIQSLYHCSIKHISKNQRQECTNGKVFLNNIALYFNARRDTGHVSDNDGQTQPPAVDQRHFLQ